MEINQRFIIVYPSRSETISTKVNTNRLSLHTIRDVDKKLIKLICGHEHFNCKNFYSNLSSSFLKVYTIGDFNYDDIVID